jgi:hypothetical protein
MVLKRGKPVQALVRKAVDIGKESWIPTGLSLPGNPPLSSTRKTTPSSAISMAIPITQSLVGVLVYDISVSILDANVGVRARQSSILSPV